MITKILLTILLKLIKQIVSKQVFDFIQVLVTEYQNKDIPNEQKRKHVTAKVKATYPQIREHLINLALEAIVANLKVK